MPPGSQAARLQSGISQAFFGPQGRPTFTKITNSMHQTALILLTTQPALLTSIVPSPEKDAFLLAFCRAPAAHLWLRHAAAPERERDGRKHAAV